MREMVVCRWRINGAAEIMYQVCAHMFTVLGSLLIFCLVCVTTHPLSLKKIWTFIY